ncbi:Ead/Ea22-like protein [Raoultella ornithinolytica]|uniref:Ead/Ea22-like protein n=1 Tax=Raoultella ornithinolytica TaxID=54291 RepID=A0ABD7QNZ4_RAOOR|nr:Ead/Ea22-like protein [Raoultella ornithinolytica]
MTTDITELALITKIKNQLKNFDTVVLREAEANALVEALEKAQRAQPCEHSMFWDASGVKRCSKCDMPEHANVHYADAAEVEIAALRQRIADLESRTVTVKLPDLRQVVSGDRYVWSDGVFNYSQDVKAELTAKGIKWEAE